MKEIVNLLVLLHEGATLDIPNCAINTGLNVEICNIFFNPNNSNYKEEYDYLEDNYGDKNIQCILSALFIPVAAEFCNKHNIKYISWIYDSPQQAIFYPEAKLNTNHIFVFDKEFLKRIEAQGCKNVYYMPCAANVDRAQKEVVQIKAKGFFHEVGFVGQLYNYEDVEKFDRIDDDRKKLLSDYYESNQCDWTKLRKWPKMPQPVLDLLDKGPVPDTMGTDYYYGTAVMSRKLAQIERIEVLNHLSKKYEVDIFTNSDTSKLENVNCLGGAEYYTMSPRVFNQTKINLNMTLPSIETGVPWRVFDIMAAGGFVLSNYQEEIEDLFEIGKEIEVFRNLEELEEKVEYYLSHDKQREEIALNGKEKVYKDYNLTNTIMKMYKKVVG